MSHLTLSGRLSTDPYFDRLSLRPSYTEWRDITVDFEEREPITFADFVVSYRAFVRYADDGQVQIQSVEVLLRRTADDLRRGCGAESRKLGLSVAELGLTQILLDDVRSESGMREVRSVIEAHQADRNEDEG